MKKRWDYEDLGEIELPKDVAAKVNRMIQEADADLEEARVNFRWGRKQVALVKRAADLMGVPYQTYIKHVVYRQAIDDLKQASGQ